MTLPKRKTFCFVLGLTLIFYLPAFAENKPVNKSTSKSPKFIIPPVVKLPLLKVNPPVRFKNTPTQVLAGLKLPNTGIYINNKPVIVPNKYTSWYYEYPLASPHKIVISAQKIASISQLRNAVPLDLDKTKSLDEDAPRLFNYRFDPLTRDFLFDIQDPAGVLSYNIYYTNSLSSPFILAQRDVAVSGTGIITWRDNGQYTGSHPSKVTMRFYRVEVNRINPDCFQITKITPENNASFLAGAKLTIQPYVLNLDNDSLLYQFSIGGTIVQPWSVTDAYLWQTSIADTGTVSVTCEVKDTKARVISKTVSYHILNPTVEEILQRIADNYALVRDFKADMTLSSTLDGKIFGAEQYLRYYFKSPHKEKTETYSDALRAAKTDIIITDGSNMHLIDPQRNIKQTVDLLADVGVDEKQFKQADLYYNKSLFLSEHNITKINSGTGTGIITVLEVIPKSQNKIYDKLVIGIDYVKGIITNYSLYKKNETDQLELIQELKTIQSQQFPNGAWLPVKMTKQPSLTSGVFISTVVYNNLRLNIGLTDFDFDPEKQ